MRLAERLTRRGVAAPALGAATVHQTSGRLISQTIAAAQTPFHLPATTAPALLAESVVHAMATTKWAIASGVILLAAGLTCGLGWVAAGTHHNGPGIGASDTGAGRSGIPTGQPNTADTQQPKPQDRAAALRQSSDEIAARIDRIQQLIMRDNAEPDSVSVAVLQSELFAFDKQILENEKTKGGYKQSVENADKRKAAQMKEGLEPSRLERWIDGYPAVKEASSRLSKARTTAAGLQQKLAAEHPIVRAAVKEITDAEAALKEERIKARPEIERQVRSDLESHHASHVTEMKRLLALYTEKHDALLLERRKLVERIAEAKRAEARRQILQDELGVYREIQIELLRQRTLTEIGQESLRAVPRPVNDPKVEAQLAELKREVEVLRIELEKLRKK
jgi:hypothetical protein